jgi:tRNA-Thr(GGU) m(6)t(6)A37 methyltransferase TsaA
MLGNMVNDSGQQQNDYRLHRLGIVHSCFKQKFGTPRQPGLVPEAEASIEILPPYDRDEAFRGLESVSHIWVLFIFHQALREQWRPTVRPPRLGGNQRIGVFATRSNFRPNPIGLSLVSLVAIERRDGRLSLEIRGGDLLDGTPVLDIKPYIPYADSVDGAEAGIADVAPPTLAVEFSETAQRQLHEAAGDRDGRLESLIRSMLSYDPRPAYQSEEGREYGCRVHDFNVIWTVEHGTVQVRSIEKIHAI